MGKPGNPYACAFDAHLDLEDFLLSAVAQRFMQQGGQVAFGFIPTKGWSELNAQELAQRWRKASENLPNRPVTLKNIIITPSCGLGLNSQTAPQAIFKMVGG